MVEGEWELERMLGLLGSAEERERRKILADTREYREAAKKIGSIMGRLEGAGKEDAVRIWGEARDFFKELRKNDPEIYAMFELSRKRIKSTVLSIATGKDIIVD